ncbi:hypothetical protein D3C85_335550 [compost metagenome]
MRVGLATAVAGARHPHQAGVQLVLHVALEYAVLDQRGALGRRAFVIHAERTTAAGQGAVVDDGAQTRGDLLAHAPAVGGTALAIEVAFQAMADRLVQQHPGPAGAHHHRQGAGRRGNRLEIDQGLAQRLAGVTHGAILAHEVAVVATPAATVAATLAAAVLLDDHADIEAHQRANIDAQTAVLRRHQDAIPDPGEADRDLFDPRIESPRGHIDLLEQFDFLRPADHVQRVFRRIQGGDLRAAEGLHPRVLPGPGNRAGRAGGLGQRLGGDGVAVGKAGFLAGLGTHADALIEVETALLDDAVLQHPGLGHLALEIQIGRIDTGTGQLAQHPGQMVEGQAARAQQVLTDG